MRERIANWLFTKITGTSPELYYEIFKNKNKIKPKDIDESSESNSKSLFDNEYNGIMKYIIFKNGINLRAIVFPKDLVHEEIKIGYGWKPVAAGFYNTQSKVCFGKSISLNLDSKSDDSHRIDCCKLDIFSHHEETKILIDYYDHYKSNEQTLML